MATATLHSPQAARPFSVSVVSSTKDIPRISAEAESRSRFFLASVSESWRPRIAVVRQEDNIVGLVYGKERLIAGFGTGIIYVDTTLGSSVSGPAHLRERVFQDAAEGFLRLPGTRALRFVVPPHGPEISGLRAVSQSDKLDFALTPVNNHVVLSLPHDYEVFLQRLGSQSRRNFRYYRRKSEAAENSFVSRVPAKAFQYAAWEMVEKGVTGAGLELVRRTTRMLSEVAEPLMAGVRSPSGEWLSVLAGWYEQDRAVMMLQLNDDKAHAKASLSSVLRGYLIEHLIRDGVKNLVFWGGVGEPLKEMVTPLPAAGVHLDKRLPHWRLLRAGTRLAMKYLSPAMAAQAEWIALPEAIADSTFATAICE
jgi:hypothetical protein